jgi:uncharacterized protein
VDRRGQERRGQVGKTTLLAYAAKQGRSYVTLDDPQVRLLAKTDPALFFQTYHTPLLIDEIQYAQELFPHIKMIADREKTPGSFWLTGSQQFHENLAGGASASAGVGEVDLTS